MVEQVIKFSDGTETVIKYRGVIVNGELISEKVEEVAEVPVEETIDEVVEVVEEPVEEETAPVEEAELG